MSYSSFKEAIYAVGRQEKEGVSLLGTATLLNKPGRLVTAAHVTNKNDENLFICKPFQLINGYQDTSENRIITERVRIESIDPFTDLCILAADNFHSHSNISLGSTDILSTGSIVDLFGYPHADTGRFIQTYQRAEIGARILVKSGEIKTKQIVLNTLARSGQSGGPIFSFQTTVLVAILIGSYIPYIPDSGFVRMGSFDPRALHQTTHAVSAEYIAEML